MFWKIVLLVVAIVLLVLNARKQCIERNEYARSRGFEGNAVAFGIRTLIAFCLNCFLSWYMIDFFISLMK